MLLLRISQAVGFSRPHARLYALDTFALMRGAKGYTRRVRESRDGETSCLADRHQMTARKGEEAWPLVMKNSRAQAMRRYPFAYNVSKKRSILERLGMEELPHPSWNSSQVRLLEFRRLGKSRLNRLSAAFSQSGAETWPESTPWRMG